MGIIQKVNQDGWYQEYDTEKDAFIGNPLRPYKDTDIEIVKQEPMDTESENSQIAKEVTFVDQIQHQLVLSEDGRTIDLEKKHFNIIDENGRIEFDADGEIIVSVAKDQLTYENFITTYQESSKQAMLLLLALQSNAAPLKRGGFDIAYMTDILVDHMVIQFSEEANAVWEALSAIQSSRPEDKKIRLTTDDLKPYTAYKSDEALYHAFKKGCEELKKTNLEFDIPDPDHDGHNIMIHWNNGAEWIGNNRKTGEKAHFDVYTNDFYRVLMSSSGIIHGAHWNRRISRGLKGYARALYMFCARNKSYTKYKGAIPGVKELTIEEIKYEFKMPVTIEIKEISRHLKNAQKKINDLPESEFSVNVKRIPEKGRIEGFRFEIKENRFIETVATEIEEIPEKSVISENPLVGQVGTALSLSGIVFTEKEIESIANCLMRNNKDVITLMAALPVFKSRIENTLLDSIEDKVAYLCTLLQNDAAQKAQKPAKKETNSFTNFPQRNYDMEELEKKIIENSRKNL